MVEESFRLPESWINCPNMGDPVNELIYPFKTIVDERFNNLVPLNKRFGVTKLQQLISKLSLRLIIDLTSENKFYDKKRLKNTVSVRIFDDGYNGIPTEMHIFKFIKLVKTITIEDLTAKIGVHCIYGFNVTGFMIVAYLVKATNMNLESAVDVFSKARPPGIFDAQYIKELKKLFDPGAKINVSREPPWVNGTHKTEAGECVNASKPKRKVKPKIPQARNEFKTPEYVSSLSSNSDAENAAKAAKVSIPLLLSANENKQVRECVKPNKPKRTVKPKIPQATNDVKTPEGSDTEHIAKESDLSIGKNMRDVELLATSVNKQLEEASRVQSDATEEHLSDDSSVSSLSSLSSDKNVSRPSKSVLDFVVPKSLVNKNMKDVAKIAANVNRQLKVASKTKSCSQQSHILGQASEPIKPHQLPPVSNNIEDLKSVAIEVNKTQMFGQTPMQYKQAFRNPKFTIPSEQPDIKVIKQAYAKAFDRPHIMNTPLPKTAIFKKRIPKISDRTVESVVAPMEQAQREDKEVTCPMKKVDTETVSTDFKCGEKSIDSDKTTRPADDLKCGFRDDRRGGRRDYRGNERRGDRSCSRTGYQKDYGRDDKRGGRFENQYDNLKSIGIGGGRDGRRDYRRDDRRNDRRDGQRDGRRDGQRDGRRDDRRGGQRDGRRDDRRDGQRYGRRDDRRDYRRDDRRSGIRDDRHSYKRPSSDTRSHISDKRSRYDDEHDTDRAANISKISIDSKLVVPLSDSGKVEHLREKLRYILRTKRTSFNGNNFIILTKNNVQKLNEKEYYHTWNTDGKRYLLFIIDEKNIYLVDESNWFFQVFQLKIPHYKNPVSSLTDSIFDGELVVDRVKDKTSNMFLISNVYAIEGRLVEETNLMKRLFAIENVTLRPRSLLSKCEKADQPFEIGMKKLLKKEFLGHVWNKLRGTVPHKMTGLTFYPGSSENYRDMTAMSFYQWQPPELKSISFKLLATTDWESNELIGDIYSHGDSTPYAKITNMSQCELKQYNNAIIKVQYDEKTKTFIMIGEEPDPGLQISSKDLPEIVDDLLHPVIFEDLRSQKQ